MIKPNLIVADGNIFLNASMQAILGNMQDRDIIHNGNHENPMYRGRGIILKTFLNTIFSNVKQMNKKGYEPTHIAIVWDKRIKGKYFKSEIIDQLEDGDSYKGDRKYVSVEDLDNPDLTQKDREKIQAELIKNTERYAAKSFIETEFPKIGIHSYHLAGWEADDLDLVWAMETEKRGGMQIHYSGDSDWSLQLREKDIHWQVNRSKLYLKTVADVRTKFSIPDHLSLLEWAELNYSAFGSHNFLKRTFDPSVKRVTKKYKEKLFSGDLSDIVDRERFDVQRKCFDVKNFPNLDKAIEMYDEVISKGIPNDPNAFKSLLDLMSIGDRDKHSMYNNYNAFAKILLDSKLNQI